MPDKLFSFSPIGRYFCILSLGKNKNTIEAIIIDGANRGRVKRGPSDEQLQRFF
jgi:hypothetical protein